MAEGTALGNEGTPMSGPRETERGSIVTEMPCSQSKGLATPPRFERVTGLTNPAASQLPTHKGQAHLALRKSSVSGCSMPGKVVLMSIVPGVWPWRKKRDRRRLSAS
jgi:hypothetical protein